MTLQYFNEGYSARVYGASFTSNPYDEMDIEAYVKWDTGWWEADNDVETWREKDFRNYILNVDRD